MNVEKNLNKFCNSFGISMQDVENKLKSITGKNHLYFTTKKTKGQYLELFYFTAISLKYPNFSDILEIGTGKSDNTIVLADLWKKAKIITCDLPEADFQFNKLGIRKNQIQRFNKKILSKSNITYVNKNSFFLPSFANKKFDFIWVDGGHNYPTVAWDIMFAYNFCKSAGYIFFDDYNPETDVPRVIDHVVKIIPEKINFLPFAAYRNENHKICWLKKD